MRTNQRIRSLAVVTSAALLLLTNVSVGADYQTTVLSDSPAGYWRLGEMPVGQAPFLNANDMAANSGSAGAAANGYYLYGATHPEPGALAGSADTAVVFDGWKSRVDVPFSLLYNTTNFTVEVWVKITNTTANRAVSPLFCRDTNSQRGFLFFANNATTKWQFRTYSLGTARNISSTNDVVYNTWVHLVGTHENIAGVGSVMRFFVNGLQEGAALTNAVNSYTPNTAAPLRIGAGNTQNILADYFWPGSMDEVAIYTSALTPEQILAHYQNGTNANRPTPYETLVTADGAAGYWRFNEAAAGGNSPTPLVANSGALGSAANGTLLGITNTAAVVPGVTNNVVGGAAGALSGDANTAIQMNGKGGMVGIPYNAGLNATNFSVECWARLDGWANAHQSPVSGRDGQGTQNGYIIYAAPVSSQPQWQFWTGPGWQTVAGPNVNIGQWYHVVGTYDAASKRKTFYVDGQIVGGAVGVNVSVNARTPLRIGAGENETGGNFFWNGLIDEVAVYPGALTAAQVVAHYTAGSGVPPAMTAAPLTVVSPANQTNWAPYSVTLNAVVTGSLPMSLQWYHVSVDGLTTNAVNGANGMSLTLNPTSVADSGNYYLTAANGAGSVDTAWAWVEIIPPTPPTLPLDLPAITPVYLGGTAGLDAVAAGTPPITYLLQSNTVTVAVSSSGFFKVPNVKLADATTSYRIVATNQFGSVTSATTHLGILTAPNQSYASVVTNLNPAGYWRLGEDSGTTAFDYWGGRNGDAMGSSYLNVVPGALVDDDDGCVQHGGSGTGIRMRDASAFNYYGTTNRFTMAAWVKATAWANGGKRFFSTRYQVGNTGGFGFGIWDANSFRFTAYGVTDVAQSTATLVGERWYHVAAVCSNLTVYFYLDGALLGTGNGAIGATGIKTSPYPLQLGGNPNFIAATDEEAFDGQIDEAAVFSRVLTSAEIKALYDARYGSLVPPTIVKQPDPAQVFVGGSARFSVEATGSSPLTYQWKTNGVAITGATGSTLTVSPVATALSGVNYSVTIQNSAGSVTSANAPLTVLTPSGFVQAVVADNPEAIWRLGEAAGSLTAYDNWGAHNGAVIGGLTFGSPGALAGEANTSASFNGTDSKIEVPYAAELNASNFTVECWARVTGGTGTYRAVVSSRNEVQGGSQGGYIIYATAGNVWSFWTGNPAGGWAGLDGPAVVENEWTHLVATFDGTTKRFYVNGILVASADATVPTNPLRALRIGAGQNEVDPGNYFFVGDIDDVAVYSKVLTADRIEYHFGLGVYGENTAPFIIQQPVAPPPVLVGSPVSLLARAGGSPFLGVQWLKDGTPIHNATNSTLSFAATTYSDNGMYSLRATNSIGGVYSTAAKLSVMPPPSFAFVTNDLVLHLKFDGDYLDASGRGNHGTAVNLPSLVPGKVGANALRYNTDVTGGQYNYVTLGTPPDLLFSSNVSFSVSYWVRFTGSPGDLPFLCNAVQSYSNFGFTFAPSYTNGGWSWSLGNGAGYVGVYGAANSINNGNWHHLLHTFDRTGAVATAVTYLDGVQVDSRAATAAGDIDSGAAVNIGQDPTGVYGETGAADIDDLGVWRRALTSYEAESIYVAGQQSGASFDATAPIQLVVQRNGNDVELIWQAGTLQQADTVDGTYAPVPGASAPYYKVPPNAAMKFYRIKP